MDSSEISTSDLLNTSSDTASSTTDQPLTDAAVTEANDLPHRIEIRTLVQASLEDEYTRTEHDRAFTEAMNEGWEIVDLTVTTGAMSANSSEWDYWLSHTRIVTLMRLVEDEGAPEAAEVEAGLDTASKAGIAEASAALTATPPDGVDAVIETLTAADREMLQPVSVSQSQDTAVIPQHVVGVDVTFAQAFASGQYTLDELRVIAEREMHQSGLDAFAAWQPQSNPHTGQAWEGLRFNALLAMADGG